MTKWQLNTKYVQIGGLMGTPEPSKVWTEKDKKTGKTTWDELQEMAQSGWELVSVTTTTYSQGGTLGLLYTFKRPIEDHK